MSGFAGWVRARWQDFVRAIRLAPVLLGLLGTVLLVVGSEGEGLARLVRENCDVLVSIPISSDVESLNASVAVSIALYEVTRCRG